MSYNESALASTGFFDYAKRHGFALHEVHEGDKNPVGNDWQHHHTSDPARWASWLGSGRNIGLNPGASRIAVLDIEAGKQEIAEEWFRKITGYSLPAPHLRSPSGGTHTYFRLADATGLTTLREKDTKWGDLIVGSGNAMCAPSYFANRKNKPNKKAGHYEWLGNETLYDGEILRPAWPRHVECTTLAPSLGGYRLEEVAWWIDRKLAGEWKDDPTALSQLDWTMLGAALKLHFGSAGLELFQRMSHDPDQAARRWDKFPAEYSEGDRTLHYYLDRDVSWMFRHEAGCPKPPPGPPLNLPPPALPGQCEDWNEPAELRVISAASFAGKPVPEREMLVEGLIPAKIAAGLYGEGAVGKSLLALMLAVAIVIGVMWLGRRVKQGPVIYLCCEDDEDEVHRRLEAICRGMSVNMAALGDLHIVPLADEDATLAATDGRSSVVTTTYRYDQIVELAERVQPVLVIGDTLADVLAATENDRMVAKQFVKKMRPLATPYGGVFLVLAHPSLSGINSGRGSSGSTGWRNTFRWDGYLHKVLDDQGRETAPRNRVLSVMKANYGPQDGEIPLRYVEGCYMLDTTRLSANGADPIAMAAKADRVFLDLLKSFIGQNRYVSVSEGKSYAPHVFAADAARQGVNKTALKAAMERLLEKGAIENAPYGAPSKKMYRLYPVEKEPASDLPTPANGVPTAFQRGCQRLPTGCVRHPPYPPWALALALEGGAAMVKTRRTKTTISYGLRELNRIRGYWRWASSGFLPELLPR